MRGWLPWCLAAAGLAVAAYFLFFADAGLQDQLDKTSSPIGAVAGIASFVAAILIARSQQSVSEDSARLALARKLHKTWTREAEGREVRNPWPIRVRLAPTSRFVAAKSPQADFLAGEVTEVAVKYLALPHRQLVVLGAPGAGKSVLVLLLVLDLLERHQDEPVPVPLSIESWNPATEDVAEFVTRRLREDHPALRKRSGETDLAEVLVTAGHVLPVLDGLDEMPADRRAPALRRLHALTSARRPFVLTSRASEYEHAVESSGAGLTLAEVVELEPVTPAEAADYLRQDVPVTRWEPVLDALATTGPVVEAFSSPLTISVARIVYRSGGNPAELLTLRDKTAVVDRLMGAFVAATFQDRPKAGRWLGNLAYMLYRTGTRDLTWRLFDPDGRGIWINGAGEVASTIATAIGLAAMVSALQLDARHWAQTATFSSVLGGGLAFMIVRNATALRSPRRTVAGGTAVAIAAWGVVAGLAALIAFLSGAPAASALQHSVTFSFGVFWIVFGFQCRHVLLQLIGQTVMALHGKLPLCLNRFLRLAHRRGVLRSTGETWQFRHALLQDHLARQVRIQDLGRHDGDTELLVAMLATRDREALRTRADSRCLVASRRYAALLAANGLYDELAARAGRDVAARFRLIRVLRERGDVEGLAQWTGAESDIARAEVLAAQGDTEAAKALLRPLRGAAAGLLLAELQAADGDFEGAFATLTPNLARTTLYVDLLAATKRYDDLWKVTSHPGRAARLASTHVPDVDPETKLYPYGRRFSSSEVARLARRHYAHHLAFSGEIAAVASWVESRDSADARPAFAAWLRVEGRFDLLRARADDGDRCAVNELWHHGPRACAPEKKAEAFEGNTVAAKLYALGLTDQNEVTELLRALAKTVYSTDEPRMRDIADIMARFGRLDSLRARADAGDLYAATLLTDQLIAVGRVAEAEEFLRERFAAGDIGSPERLVDFLAAQHDRAGLRALVRTGDDHAARHLALLGDPDDVAWVASIGACERRPFWSLPD